MKKHGFGPAQSYFLEYEGELYDSKAIVGVAHGYSGIDKRPLSNEDFSGGEETVAKKLESLGFAVRRETVNPDWSTEEVGACVGDYFGMLADELQHRSYSKTERRRVLAAKLSGRSEQAIEFKHCNVSAVLRDLGLPYINGYKPRGHTQQALEQAVGDFLDNHESVVASLARHAEESPPDPEGDRSPLLQVEPPKGGGRPASAGRTGRARKIDYAEREARNRKLGEQGEALVVESERSRLREAGREDLAARVEWVSKTRGDGLGYDILSFDTGSGNELFIEVKTTRCGKEHPFIISANEVEFSREHAESYCLYRVFDLDADSQFYVLEGNMQDVCQLHPKDYSAIPV